MDSIGLDPYEQQLLSVFNNYDYDSLGSLDIHGLTQLCQTLQLEEHSSELIKNVLKDSKQTRVTFAEFKNALLALLGNIQNKSDSNGILTNNKHDKGSPEREVSPKFIYGAKKYGRRSRPRTDQVNVEEHNDLNSANQNFGIQRSNSEICNRKKRKTNFKLQRCSSFPIRDDNEYDTSDNDYKNDVNEVICTEEMLRDAWRTLGVGEDGYLNQTELVLVCDAIGLHSLASGVLKQLSDKLNLDYDHRISFQELLEALKRDETWSEVLSSPNHGNLTGSHSMDDIMFPNSQTFQYVSLGPDANGFVNAETLIEMWENVGITAPKELLHELGFNSRQINVTDLATVLDHGLKGLQENNGNVLENTHVILSQANLILYQSEIRCLKSILEQLNAERDKLKSDVVEANNRAALLAQEVDDNHVKMEANTLNQVKLLEQRHSDILRELSQQHSDEKEDISQINLVLEARVANLELEIGKLKSDLATAQTYLTSVEKENHALVGRVSDLKQTKNALTEQVMLLETECHMYSELEHEKIKPLLNKLTTLESENTELRDHRDEMRSEIETLTGEMNGMKTKLMNAPKFAGSSQAMDENAVSMVFEGLGVGGKRRSDYSPSKDLNLMGLANGSPHLGKMRKIPKNPEDYLTSSESGFDTELECLDSPVSICSSDSKEITRLQAKIVFLEQILLQHDIAIPMTDSNEIFKHLDSTSAQLNKRVKQLENIINDMRQEVENIAKNDGANCDNLSELIIEKLNNMMLKENYLNHEDGYDFDVSTKQSNVQLRDASTMTEETENASKFQEEIRVFKKKNEELSEKCIDLENCIELLKTEYEKCEEYWASKLDEERQIFEREQFENGEKLGDVLNKLAEYEEQFQQQDQIDSRLPPIEEKFNLEKQFTDLEEEYDEYRIRIESVIYDKDEEIDSLKGKLSEMSTRVVKSTSDAGVQVDLLDEYNLMTSIITNKMMQLTNHVVECTNLVSDFSGSEPSPNTKERLNETFSWNKETTEDDGISKTSSNTNFSLPNTWFETAQNNHRTASSSLSAVQTMTASTSSAGSSLEKSSTPCRPKRTRKHDKNMHVYKKNSGGGGATGQGGKEMMTTATTTGDEDGGKNERTQLMAVSAVNNLHSKINHLEKRCRHLHSVLREQHFTAEKNFHHYWVTSQGEKAELQCQLKYTQDKLEQQDRVIRDLLDKLTRNDILVKELYVENSYLHANVQRVEQHQKHIFSHCNPNNSL